MSKLPSPFTSSSLAALAPMAAAIGAMLSITLGASLAKSLFPHIGPAGTTVLRLGIAALMLAVAFRVWRIRPDRRQWRAVLPYALSLSLMNLLFYMAIARVPLGIALAIEFIGPLTVALLGLRRRGDFIWLGLAVVGLLLVLATWGRTGHRSTRGCFGAGGRGLLGLVYHHRSAGRIGAGRQYAGVWHGHRYSGGVALWLGAGGRRPAGSGHLDGGGRRGGFIQRRALHPGDVRAASSASPQLWHPNLL